MQSNIPRQREGGSSDTVSERVFDTESEAKTHLEIVKKRFLNINSWEILAGEEKAEFSLRDGAGNLLTTEPEIGNYFKIRVPGLKNPTGNGYDWVKVEEKKHEISENSESVYVRVRPCSDPTMPQEKTAHFFNEKATSNFIIKREFSKISAEVHGRNEEPNIENLSALEKVRNFLVAVGGIIAGSKFQWKALTDGLLKDAGKADNE